MCIRDRFFTGYRKTRNLPALRQAWNKRISMEVALGKISHAISSGKKSGMQLSLIHI